MPSVWLRWLGVLLTIALVTGTADAAPWSSVRSSHFTVVGDAPGARLRDVSWQFEQFREVLERILPNTRLLDQAPTVIVVFESDRSMRSFKPQRDGKVQDEVSGVVMAGDDLNYVVLSIEAGSQAVETVLGAYATLLIRSTIPGAPLWVVNGIGRYYSTFTTTADGKGASIGVPPKSLLARARGRLLPVETVLAAGYNSALYRDDDEREVFDGVCWALVHYIVTSVPEGAAALSTYLGLTMRGTPSVQAFTDAFHMEPAELTPKLSQYVGRPLMQSSQVTFGERPSASRPQQVDTLSDAQAQAHMAGMFVSQSRDAQAEQALVQAFAGPSPPATAHFARGRLRLRQRRPAEAWPDLLRAAELDEGDYSVQFLLGHAAFTLASGRSAGEDRPRLEAGLKALDRAIVLQPESAEALYAKAGTLVLLEGDLSAARAAAEKAAELGPGREEYRLLLAQVALRQRDTAAAREALGTLAARASRLEIVQRARTILGEIAKAETAAAAAEKAEAARAAAAANDATAPARDSRAAAPSSASGSAARGAGVGDGPRAGAYELMLRPQASAERRILGTVTTIECGPLGVLFYVRLPSQTMRLFTPMFEAVEFITYRDAVGGSISCGSQSSLDHVFVTFRPAANARTKMGSAYDGEVVAVEMLPRDYTP